MDDLGWYYDNVMPRARREPREKVPNAAWRSVKLPVRRKGFICIFQAKELEKWTPSRWKDTSELKN